MKELLRQLNACIEEHAEILAPIILILAAILVLSFVDAIIRWLK